jgi:hypothetical protein
MLGIFWRGRKRTDKPMWQISSEFPKRLYHSFVEACAVAFVYPSKFESKYREVLDIMEKDLGPDFLQHFTGSVEKRVSELLVEKMQEPLEKPEEEEEEVKEVVNLKRIEIPEDKAQWVLVLWRKWFEKSDDCCLEEKYEYQKALYSVCPGLTEWGPQPQIYLDVIGGKLFVLNRDWF